MKGKNSFSSHLQGLLLGITISICILGISVLFAWTEPSSNPPEGNVPGPINISNTGQSKSGGLILNTGGASIGLVVDKGNVGIGTTNPSNKLEVSGSGNVVFNTVGNVGIGTTSPGAKLEVAGQVKIRGGTPGAGKVLTSDANGLASWSAASGISYTYYCTTSAVLWGDPGCINAGGSQGYCPSGYTQKLALGSWGSCYGTGYDNAPGAGSYWPLMPGVSDCGPHNDMYIRGQAYVCSQ